MVNLKDYKHYSFEQNHLLGPETWSSENESIFDTG